MASDIKIDLRPLIYLAMIGGVVLTMVAGAMLGAMICLVVGLFAPVSFWPVVCGGAGIAGAATTGVLLHARHRRRP